MTRYLIAAALISLAAGPALAADLPQPAPPPAQAPAAYAPAPAVYDWSGFYFGVNGGYGFGNTDWSDPNNASGLGSTGNFNLSGYVAGGTLGVNFQTGAFVFGLEGDFGASGLDGKSSSAYCGSNLGFAATAQCETKNTWLSTVRGRLGFAADRVLFYGTAGGAFGNIEAGAGGSFQTSTKVGWAAGAGLEAAFADNWTARIEYLFVDLQNSTCNTATACGNDVVNNTLVAASQTVKFDASLIRVGLDYKFR